MSPNEKGLFPDEFLITPPYGSYITYMLAVSNGVNSSRSNTLEFVNGKYEIIIFNGGCALIKLATLFAFESNQI